jgi:nucleoside-diphosphate-sugar epimerase
MTQRVLVTGGQGLVGKAVAMRLLAQGLKVRVSTRGKLTDADFHLEFVQTTGLGSATDWRSAVQGVDVLVHCAARVHVMRDTETDPLAEYRAVNVEGSLGLARQAAAAGARRFVFVSSIKVNGEATLPGFPFTADGAPSPQDAYSLSKHEAELGLRQLAADTGIEVVIIRPPLVYGPGVKANFASMMHWLQRGVLLPLGAIHNQRSLIALDNLVDLIFTCLTHPAAANQTFLVSDGEDMSTTQLLMRMGAALGKPARLIPIPVLALKLSAALVGKSEFAQRLCGSLQIDMRKTQELLGWRPPFSVEESLTKTAEGYLREAAV